VVEAVLYGLGTYLQVFTLHGQDVHAASYRLLLNACCHIMQATNIFCDSDRRYVKAFCVVLLALSVIQLNKGFNGKCKGTHLSIEAASYTFLIRLSELNIYGSTQELLIGFEFVIYQGNAFVKREF
jgi:hypothetical protein